MLFQESHPIVPPDNREADSAVDFVLISIKERAEVAGLKSACSVIRKA
jgi:hypothetical protein